MISEIPGLYKGIGSEGLLNALRSLLKSLASSSLLVKEFEYLDRVRLLFDLSDFELLKLSLDFSRL